MWKRGTVLSTAGPAEVSVGKIQEHLPIFTRRRMSAGPDVVAERAADQLAGTRENLGPKAAGPEQGVHRFGGQEHFKLTRRIGPRVLFGIAEQQGPRRDECGEAVLVA